MKTRMRIVQKTKEGCIIDLKAQGKHQVSWEDFNKNFRIEDKFWAVPNEEFLKLQVKVEDALSSAAASYIRLVANGKIENPKDEIVWMGILSGCVKEICELLECSPIEAAKLVRCRIDEVNQVWGVSFPIQQQRSMTKTHTPEVHRGATTCLGDIEALKKLSESLKESE